MASLGCHACLAETAVGACTRASKALLLKQARFVESSQHQLQLLQGQPMRLQANCCRSTGAAAAAAAGAAPAASTAPSWKPIPMSRRRQNLSLAGCTGGSCFSGSSCCSWQTSSSNEVHHPGKSTAFRSPPLVRKMTASCQASNQDNQNGATSSTSAGSGSNGNSSDSDSDSDDEGGNGRWGSSRSRGRYTWGTPVGYPPHLPPPVGHDSPGVSPAAAWRRAGQGMNADPLVSEEGSLGKKALKPRRIILVRHGQSEGNVDESAYTRIPDSKIALTRKGWEQAVECGQYIKEMIEADGEEDWSVYFYVSPYLRCTQTLRGIGTVFERKRIAGVREEPRIREQDFGNFQCRDRMAAEKKIRLRYGRFFYRFPDGESAADVYDRVTGFRETLRADIDIGRFQRPDFASANTNLVLVSHGLTLRVFLMRWYKWTVKQFEGLYNFDNAAPLVMQLGEGGRYSLRIHQTREQLREFGMTEEMVDDQEWQLHAKPGDLNFDWLTSGPSFFDHFDDSSPTGVMEDYICEGLVDECMAESPVGERS